MFDDTEAAHLAEIEEYLGDIEECEISYYNRKPSTTSEKHHYVMAKTQCFNKSDVGKYVITQRSRRNRKVMPFMYLVDRTRIKSMWWSPDAALAMVFEKQSAAEYQAKKYHYNNVKVKQITPAMANRKYFEQEYGN